LQDAADVSSFQKYADLSSQAIGNYSYFIRIELQPGARVRKLRISPVVQISKFLFPVLVTKNPNDLVYNDLSPSRTMRVTARIPGVNPPIRGLQASSLVSEDSFRSLAQDHGASNIVDGDPDSYATPGSNHLDYSVRLNAIYHVTAVSIDWNNFGTDPRSINNWTLLGRNGNQPWQPLGSGGPPASPTSNIAIDTVATELRVVADGNNAIGVYELRAFGTLLQPLEAVFNKAKVSTGPLRLTPVRTGGNALAPQLPQIDGESDPNLTLTLQQQTTLSSPAHISAVQITWPDTAVNSGTVQEWTVEERSGADQPWTVVAEGTGVTSSVSLVYLDCIATELRVHATSSSGWINSYNVQLFGASTWDRLSASSLSVESSVPGFGPAENLADGDPATAAYPGAVFFDYLLDPGQPASVDAVKVIWGGFGTDASYINSWQLLGLPEESTIWQVVRRGGFPNASETLVPVQGRYRKLRIAAQSASNWIGIYEVQVFGSSIAPITAPLLQSANQTANTTVSKPPTSPASPSLRRQYDSGSVKPGTGRSDVAPPLKSLPQLGSARTSQQAGKADDKTLRN
jgi:hypothetical protein